MNKEQILKIIDRKYAVISEETKATGVCLRLNNGAIINCFNNGNHNVQGKNAQEVKDLLDGKICNSVKRKIFVVYGHDDIARTQLEAMLRRWDLEPIILDQQVSAGRMQPTLQPYSSSCLHVPAPHQAVPL